MKKMVKYKGFTLAEVLVTLAVIGVVAALTIPSLLQGSEDTQTRTKAKKAYSMLSNALGRINTKGDVFNFSPSGTDEEFKDKFCEHLNCIKSGVMNEFFNSEYKYYENSSGWDFSSDTHSAAILNNGMLIRFHNMAFNCANTEGSLSNLCATIDVDTNGKNGPNMIGKDYLIFLIIEENKTYQLTPMGTKDGFVCSNPGTSWETSAACVSHYILGKELP